MRIFNKGFLAISGRNSSRKPNYILFQKTEEKRSPHGGVFVIHLEIPWNSFFEIQNQKAGKCFLSLKAFKLSDWKLPPLKVGRFIVIPEKSIGDKS